MSNKRSKTKIPRRACPQISLVCRMLCPQMCIPPLMIYTISFCPPLGKKLKKKTKKKNLHCDRLQFGNTNSTLAVQPNIISMITTIFTSQTLPLSDYVTFRSNMCGLCNTSSLGSTQKAIIIDGADWLWSNAHTTAVPMD